MRKPLALLLLIAACTSSTAAETTTTSAQTPFTAATPQPTAKTLPPPCPTAPYEIGFLPVNLNEAGFDPSGLEPDVWTSVGGTQTTFFGRNDGTVAIALIRGTLPPLDWPAEKGIVQIDAVDAAVGPHPDGTWVAGWFVEPAARCDLYTMVFYPPWNPSDVEAVLDSMTRIAG